jgi:putative solute:sodium symporter small subunit
MDDNQRKAYWKANMRLIAVLLGIWAMVSLGAGILLVRVLNLLSFLSLPLGFWVAQQGAIFIFVVIIFYYARAMDRLDRQHHVDN